MWIELSEELEELRQKRDDLESNGVSDDESIEIIEQRIEEIEILLESMEDFEGMPF